MLAVVVCLSVRLPVESQVGVLLKLLNVGSHKQRHTMAQGLQFSDTENLGKSQTGSQKLNFVPRVPPFKNTSKVVRITYQGHVILTTPPLGSHDGPGILVF